MATYRFGNNYRLLVNKESVYGTSTQGWTAAEALIIPDKSEVSKDVQQIQTNVKTQSGLATMCEARPGYENATVVLSGMLSNEHEFLWAAMGLTTVAGPPKTYTLDKLPASRPSYTISRVWKDELDAGKSTFDLATGCVLAALTISGASGDMLRYQATFNAKTIDREQKAAIAGTDPGTICTAGFNFGNITNATLLKFGDSQHLKSFTLNFNFDTADDATQYQNSNQRLETILYKAVPEFSYVTNYDASNANYDAVAENLLHGSVAIPEKLVFELTKVNKKKTTWQIDMNGQLTSYSLADPDTAIFENNVTERLCHFGSTNYPVKITVIHEI